MIDPATVQAFAAVCAVLVAALVAITGWMYWLIRDTERRLNDRMDNMERRLTDRTDRMEQRHTEQMESMERRLTDRMDRMEQRFTDRMDQQHRDVLTLLEGHTHDDGTPAAFRRLTGADD